MNLNTHSLARRTAQSFGLAIAGLCVLFFASDLALATGADNDLCPSVIFVALKTPPALLPREIPRLEIEVEESGAMYNDQWKMPYGNENYLYLIDELGNTWITPQYLRVPYDDTKYMATHRSLTRRMERHYREAGIEMPGILASGQLGARYGEFVRLDNRSDGYHGGREHLDFANNIFRLRGLELHPNSALIDFSVVAPGKTEAEVRDPNEFHEKRKELLTVAHNPAFQALRDRWRGVLTKVYRRFPDPHQAGVIDDEKFIRMMFSVATREPSMMESTVVAGTILQHAQESLDFITYKTIGNPEAAEILIRNIEYMLTQAP